MHAIGLTTPILCNIPMSRNREHFLAYQRAYYRRHQERLRTLARQRYTPVKMKRKRNPQHEYDAAAAVRIATIEQQIEQLSVLRDSATGSRWHDLQQQINILRCKIQQIRKPVFRNHDEVKVFHQ